MSDQPHGSCPICHDTDVPLVFTPCAHAMCRTCMADIESRGLTCPLCRSQLPTSRPSTAAAAEVDVEPVDAPDEADCEELHKCTKGAPHPTGPRPAGPPPVIVKTGTFTSAVELEEPPRGYSNSAVLWTAHGNPNGDNTGDIVGLYGVDRKPRPPYAGWPGGAYVSIAVHDSISHLVVVQSGAYTSPEPIPIPAGFDPSECKFLWFSAENSYGGDPVEVSFGFGAAPHAGMPYDGRGGCKFGAWLLIAYKSEAPIHVTTGTHTQPHTIAIPPGCEPRTAKFLWGSMENKYDPCTKDVVPMYGDTQHVQMPYNGVKYWHGGTWMCIAETLGTTACQPS